MANINQYNILTEFYNHGALSLNNYFKYITSTSLEDHYSNIVTSVSNFFTPPVTDDQKQDNAYNLYGQIYGVYPYMQGFMPIRFTDKIYFDEKYAEKLVNSGLPKAYDNINMSKTDFGMLFIIPGFNTYEWTITGENMYNMAKEKGMKSLVEAMDNIGYLNDYSNIETSNAKLAINKGFFTKEQLVKCNPEKVKLLTSDNAIKALEKGLFNAEKLYQLPIGKLTSLTSDNAIKALESGVISLEKIESLEDYQFDRLVKSTATEKAIEASSKTFLLAAQGDKQALEIALAEGKSPNTAENFESVLSTAILSGHKDCAHLLVSKGGHFNHFDFERTDGDHAKTLINSLPEFLSKQELKQALAPFETASSDCSIAIQGFCVLKTTGDVTTHVDL